jgi:ABC-2 type transport system permease protein
VTRRLPDWLVIARREFLERVRTKWFAIVTALGPLFMIGIMVVPVVLATMKHSATIQVVDHTGKGVGADIQTALHKDGWNVTILDQEPAEAVLFGRIRDKTINGFLIIPADALDKGEPVYQGDNATNQASMAQLKQSTYAAIIHARAIGLGLRADQLEALLIPPQLQTHHSTGELAAASGAATFILGYLVMIILYMAIVLYAVAVMRSVVMEKTNRVVEIMVAAAKPRALMLGKILGVGGAGLAQLTLWLAMAVAMITFREPILGLFGKSGGFAMPPLAIGDAAVILCCFLLGFLFYASLYAAIGAMVSSDQEAQQAQVPITMLLVVTMLCMQLVANDPRGGTAEILTIVPFSSPILMPMRWLLGGASTLDVILSLGVLAASAYLIASLSARIYRVGILMYGKRPGLGELIRWLRYR